MTTDSGISHSPGPAMHCSVCGYPLYGPPEQTHCPKCATPILEDNSHNPILLEHADLDYLRTLRSGIRIVLIAHAVQIFLGIVNMGVAVLRAFAQLSQQTPGSPQPNYMMMPSLTPLDIALSIVGAFAMLFVLVGWWKITTPDPSLHHADTRPNHRAAARIWTTIFIAYWIASSIFMYAIMFMNAGSPMSFQYTLLISAPGFVAFLLLIPLYIYVMLYLQWLAFRVPDRSSYKLAKTLVWLAPILATVGYCIAGLGPIAAFILSLILLLKLHKGICAHIDSRDPNSTPAFS